MDAEPIVTGQAGELMQWFRAYHEMVEDLKLKRLPPAQRWVWIAVLTIASQSPQRGRLLIAEGEPATTEDVVLMAAVDRADVAAALEAFERQGMIHRDGDVWVVTNWDKRQRVSDDAAIRKRRQRERERSAEGPDGGGGGGVDASRDGHTPDTETETETDTAAGAPEGNVIPFATDAERKIVGYLTAVPGMEQVAAAEVLAHYRERREAEGFTDAEALREAVKYRDWYREKRARSRGRFRNWRNAITNWFTADKVKGERHGIGASGGRGAGDAGAAYGAAGDRYGERLSRPTETVIRRRQRSG